MKTKTYKIPPEQDLNDELRPYYRVDYRKSRPNRFAGRPKIITGAGQGGKRNGAGRKPAREPIERRTITLLKSDAAFLKKIDKRLSVAIRKMIEQARAANR